MNPIPGGKTRVSHMNVAASAGPLPSMAGPKDTSQGKSLGGNSTNSFGGYIHPTKAESPNSKAHSRNQYPGMKG